MTWVMTVVARFLLTLTILILTLTLTLTQNKRSDAPLGYSTGLWMAT